MLSGGENLFFHFNRDLKLIRVLLCLSGIFILGIISGITLAVWTQITARPVTQAGSQTAKETASSSPAPVAQTVLPPPTVEVPRTPRAARKETLPEPRAGVYVLEDFASLAINRRASGVGEMAGNGGTCRLEVYATNERANGILRVIFDVPDRKAYAGYRYVLRNADLRSLTMLSMKVKGENGGEIFAVELSDGKATQRVSLDRYLASGCSDQWQIISIPLDQYDRIRAWGSMRTLSIVFDHAFGEPYFSSVFIQEVKFIP